ncbi:hypothetical protein MHB48_15055 [Psychrobacillus sp. FSL H8-0483]|uniref:hypothetical protein n=1 Tax=Psychrobacillus sp. FSL H8-0483 TaxID=2921389 RepID=UPI00315B34FC
MSNFNRNKENKETISISAISKELEGEYELEAFLTNFFYNSERTKKKVTFSYRTYESKFLDFITRYDSSDEEKEFSKSLFKDITGSYAIPLDKVPFFKALLLSLALNLTFYNKDKIARELNYKSIPSENVISSEDVEEAFSFGELIISRYSKSDDERDINLYYLDQLIGYNLMKLNIRLTDLVEVLLLNTNDLPYYEQVNQLQKAVNTFEEVFLMTTQNIILESLLQHFPEVTAEKIREDFDKQKKEE